MDLFGRLWDYYKGLADLIQVGEKKAAIWGYWKGGAFSRYMLESQGVNREQIFFIDKYVYFPDMGENRVFRPSVLNYLDSDEIVLLSTVYDFLEIEKFLNRYGFELGKNCFDVRGDGGCSYLEHLEMMDKEIDFGRITKEMRSDIYQGDYHEYTPFDYPTLDKIFDEILKLDTEKDFFDIGCGKGSILPIAYARGMNRIGGIEYLEDAYLQALKNMKKLGIKTELIHGDASQWDGYDKYSIFFFYNPFGGKVMQDTLKKLREKADDSHRKIFFVYVNPFYHELVLQMGFKLYKQLKIDAYDPIMNIYVCDRI